MRFILPALLHGAPLVPFALGYYYVGVAMLLLVALPYIKLKKFEAQIADIEAKAPEPRHRKVDAELAEIRKTSRLWAALTFRPDEPK